MSDRSSGRGHVVGFFAVSNSKGGAGDGLRTRYLDLGKVALYQVSYSRAVKRRFYRLAPVPPLVPPGEERRRKPPQNRHQRQHVRRRQVWHAHALEESITERQQGRRAQRRTEREQL